MIGVTSFFFLSLSLSSYSPCLFPATSIRPKQKKMTRLMRAVVAASSPLLLLLPLFLLLVGGGGGRGRGACVGVVLASGFAGVPPSTSHRRHHHHRRTTTTTTTVDGDGDGTATCLGSSSSVEEAAPSSPSSSSSPSSPSSVFDVVSPRNWDLLSARGRRALERLVSHDHSASSSGRPPHAQAHVYGDWPDVGVDDDGKIALAEQVSR